MFVAFAIVLVQWAVIANGFYAEGYHDAQHDKPQQLEHIGLGENR